MKSHLVSMLILMIWGGCLGAQEITTEEIANIREENIPDSAKYVWSTKTVQSSEFRNKIARLPLLNRDKKAISPGGLTYEQVHKCLVSDVGIRHKSSGQRPGSITSNEPIVFETLRTFDGDRYLALTSPTSPDKRPQGEIRASDEWFRRNNEGVLVAVTSWFAPDIVKGGSVLEVSNDGIITVGVESEAYRRTFKLDRKRGCVLKERRTFKKSTNGEFLSEVMQIKYDDLPPYAIKSWSKRNYNESGRSIVSTIADVSGFEARPAIPSGAFTLTFPKRTLVEDYIAKDGHKRKVAIEDGVLRPISQEKLVEVITKGRPPEEAIVTNVTDSRRWVLGTVTCIVGVGVILMFLKTQRTKT